MLLVSCDVARMCRLTVKDRDRLARKLQVFCFVFRYFFEAERRQFLSFRGFGSLACACAPEAQSASRGLGTDEVCEGWGL